MKIVDYASAIEYLYSLELYGIKLGLENIGRILSKLGDPHLDLKYVHVTGTKGKGSVCAMLASVLRAASYRVGLYISPHLVSFCERMSVNGEQIPPEAVVDLSRNLQRIALEIEAETDVHPTYFEIATAMAFAYFKSKNVDLAVLEVGMGGRLDATNIITPLVSVINEVSYDHMEFLGGTLQQIAYEKAGVIKPHVPIICGAQQNEAYEVIARTAAEKSAELFTLDKDFNFRLKAMDQNGITVDVALTNPSLLTAHNTTGQKSAELTELRDIRIPLLGSFQGRNCAIAIAVLSLLRRSKFRINPDAVRTGLAALDWPARIQIIQRDPTVVLDVSHNPLSIANLVETVKSLFDYSRLLIVIGVVRDKDWQSMVRLLAALDPAVIAVRPDTNRALDPVLLQNEFRKHGTECTVIPDVCTGVGHALFGAKPDDLVVITGSFYTAGAALSCWAGRTADGHCRDVSKR